MKGCLISGLNCFWVSSCEMCAIILPHWKKEKLTLYGTLLILYDNSFIMAEKYNDMHSEDAIDMEKLLESTDREKKLLDDVLEKYRNGIF